GVIFGGDVLAFQRGLQVLGRGRDQRRRGRGHGGGGSHRRGGRGDHRLLQRYPHRTPRPATGRETPGRSHPRTVIAGGQVPDIPGGAAL
ncbi:MAG: hypothetical protein, partial [Olavius algarvensis Gamma 1 endosymbiont]